MKSIVLCAVLVSLLAAAATAQEAPPPNPIGAHSKFVYGVLGRILVRAAETMPEEHYAFKPAETVRSFGQIVGHVADSQYFFCSVASGAKNPAPRVEKTKTSKADLVAALKDAFAYCESAYAGLTDASGSETVKLMGRDAPKLGVLAVSQSHTMEHYGNLVTYMRMKNLVPPTSEPEFMQQVAK